MSLKSITNLKNLIIDLNKSAIQSLQQDDFIKAHELLTQAKLTLKSMGHSQKILKLKAVTYNNFGCFHKRQGNLQKALAYLLQTLVYDSRLEDRMNNVSGTYLNVSTIYTELEDYNQALKFALKGVSKIEEKFNESNGDVNTLIIAYQNLGSIYGKMGKRSEGRGAIEHAYELAVKYYGILHVVTKNLAGQLKSFAFKKKQNPAIEKMLNYFEKHAFKTSKKNNSFLNSDSQEEETFKPYETQTYRQLQSFLQPIIEYNPKKPTSKDRTTTQSPQKSKIPIPELKKHIFSPVTSSKKSITHSKKYKPMILKLFPSEKSFNNSLSPKLDQKSTSLVNKANTPLSSKKPIRMKISSVSKKLYTFQSNFSIFQKSKNDNENPYSFFYNLKNNKIDKETKDLINSSIIIQKYIRGFLARKKYKSLKKSKEDIEKNIEKFIEKKNYIGKKYYGKGDDRIVKGKNEESVVKEEKKDKVHVESIKKKSLIEKILLIQKHVRIFLDKRKDRDKLS
ncbi:hypothetical protein SteCoe_13132 [Stentor coeruleus]|uniref:Uncharacterized protein n=1 Tax=Stentor coeruleus TaxID=5963 RepID=A0A1R2C940_9CILI|nr:hypothetical protein SteCoe_13132 [Stentor coeruleus]